MRLNRLFMLILALALCAAGIYAVFSFDGGADRAADSRVHLNEVMASNKGSVPDAFGKFPDWVELYNPAQSDMDISGYGISNDKKSVAKWTFPAGTRIEAGGYLVVYFSSEAGGGALHAPFKLNHADALVLTNASGVPIDSLQLRSVAQNATLIRDDTGTWAEFAYPSPGFANTEEGAEQYRASLRAGVRDNGVRINEIMASNATAFAGPTGDYPDWIELYNTLDEDVDLSLCGLSDKMDQPMKWVFPEGTVIKAKSVLLVYCSKRDGVIDSELHTSFGLRAYEETAVLSNMYGEIVDSVSFREMARDVSLARSPDGTGEPVLTDKPTPGEMNVN